MTEQEQAEQPTASAPRRVVVAEDESLIRLDIVEILRDNGFDEEFRVVSRPDADNRFPAVHLLCRSR